MASLGCPAACHRAGKRSSFLPHHCPHQPCGGEAQKGIPTPRKEAEGEFLSAEDPLAHTWHCSASSSCLLAWRFPPAHGDDKLFQPHDVPKATPVPSARGCQGCLRQGWGPWGALDSAPKAAPPAPSRDCGCHHPSPWSRDHDTAAPQRLFGAPHAATASWAAASRCHSWAGGPGLGVPGAELLHCCRGRALTGPVNCQAL